MTAATADRGTRSRRAILAAATPIFERDGYAAASLNQIIAASGLTKGGFYYHFASKQELALAVLADHNTQWTEQVRL
jgi:AcrR family transcriptional regulator